jgi:hypothetical protein
MPQYLLQGKYVTTIDEKSGGKGMSAEMSVKSSNTRPFGQPRKYQLNAVFREWLSNYRQKDIVRTPEKWLGTIPE